MANLGIESPEDRGDEESSTSSNESLETTAINALERQLGAQNITDVENSSNNESENPKEVPSISDLPDQIKVPMNGATRKRFKTLCAAGYSEEDARIQAKLPLPDHLKKQNPSGSGEPGSGRNVANFNKHGKRLNTSNRSQPDQLAKKGRSGLQSKQVINRATGLKFSDVADMTLVGIFPSEFPARRLNDEEVDLIRTKILISIAGQKDESIKPRFTQQFTIRSGWLIFYCSGPETAKWLKSLPLWSELSCHALDQSEFPRLHVATGYFRDSADLEPELILNMIQGQNMDIDTSSWYVVKKSTEGRLAVLTVELDEMSVEQLSSQNYHVHYGFGQRIKLKPKLINSPAEVTTATREEAPDAAPDEEMKDPATSITEGMEVDASGDSKVASVHNNEPPESQPPYPFKPVPVATANNPEVNVPGSVGKPPASLDPKNINTKKPVVTEPKASSSTLKSVAVVVNKKPGISKPPPKGTIPSKTTQVSKGGRSPKRRATKTPPHKRHR